MKVFIKLLLFLPLLFSCQEKFNKVPYDYKEENIRKFPVEEAKSMVLDSLWDKRDSNTYLRLKNLDIIMMKEVNYIPNWIGDFSKLKLLWIVNEKNKKIKSIPSNVGKLSNLIEFIATNNEIKVIPESFYNLKKLNKLEIGNNKIETISPLVGNLENLKSINLSDNPITNIPNEICELQKLEFLVLENTQIKELPKCLGTLQNLDWINVSGTQLTVFPVEILNAPKLDAIHAKNLKLKNYKEIEAICKKKHITFYYDE